MEKRNVKSLLKDFARMTDGVVAVDSNQRVILWNRAAEELLGVSAKKALGRYCYEIVCGRTNKVRVYVVKPAR